MVITAGERTLRYYWDYINVDLEVLGDFEEVVHRAAAECKVRRIFTRKGSLILTSDRVLFLSPEHPIARWQNCVIPLPLERIATMQTARLWPKWFFGFSGELSIVTPDGHRYTFALDDADEWCGAIQHQSEMAGHSIAN